MASLFSFFYQRKKFFSPWRAHPYFVFSDHRITNTVSKLITQDTATMINKIATGKTTFLSTTINVLMYKGLTAQFKTWSTQALHQTSIDNRLLQPVDSMSKPVGTYLLRDYQIYKHTKGRHIWPPEATSSAHHINNENVKFLGHRQTSASPKRADFQMSTGCRVNRNEI